MDIYNEKFKFIPFYISTSERIYLYWLWYIVYVP